MITSIILAIPLLIITALCSLFPVVVVPTAIITALSQASDSLYSLNAFIPVPTFALAVTLLMGVEIYILSFKVVRWGISYLPFVGGKGV